MPETEITSPPLTSLTLVLPAHNEALNLPGVLASAAEVMPRVAHSFDVIVVDDGSTDDTSKIAADEAQKWGIQLSVIRHERKSGYGRTVGDGLRAAKGDWVAFTDSDGQFDMDDFVVLAQLAARADLVGGYRRTREDAFMRSVVSFVFNTLLRIIYGLRIRDVDCAMKIIRRSFLDVARVEARSALINAELYWKAQHGGFTTRQAPVTHLPRVAGVRSGARPKAIVRAIKELIVFRFRLRKWRPLMAPQEGAESA